MNDSNYNKLREAGWRRKLTAAEAAEVSAWLETHPEARADWEAETRLNQVLGSLPDVPVATNFTARVLQTVERDAASAARRGTAWSWRSLLPKVAAAGVTLCAILFGFQAHQESARRTRLAQSVAAVSEVSSLPGPEILEDFDAIRQLDPAPAADPGLLAVYSLLQ